MIPFQPGHRFRRTGVSWPGGLARAGVTDTPAAGGEFRGRGAGCRPGAAVPLAVSRPSVRSGARGAERGRPGRGPRRRPPPLGVRGCRYDSHSSCHCEGQRSRVLAGTVSLCRKKRCPARLVTSALGRRRGRRARGWRERVVTKASDVPGADVSTRPQLTRRPRKSRAGEPTGVLSTRNPQRR